MNGKENIFRFSSSLHMLQANLNSMPIPRGKDETPPRHTLKSNLVPKPLPTRKLVFLFSLHTKWQAMHQSASRD